MREVGQDWGGMEASHFGAWFQRKVLLLAPLPTALLAQSSVLPRGITRDPCNVTAPAPSSCWFLGN